MQWRYLLLSGETAALNPTNKDRQLTSSVAQQSGGRSLLSTIALLSTGVAQRCELDVFSGVTLFLGLFVNIDSFRTIKHRTTKLAG